MFKEIVDRQTGDRHHRITIAHLELTRIPRIGCVAWQNRNHQKVSVCFFYVSLYFFPLNLICNMTTFRFFLPSYNLQVDGVCKDRICSCMVLHAPFPLIWYDYFQRKIIVLTFDPTPGAEGVCKDRICACMLLHLRFHLTRYAT